MRGCGGGAAATGAAERGYRGAASRGGHGRASNPDLACLDSDSLFLCSRTRSAWLGQAETRAAGAVAAAQEAEAQALAAQQAAEEQAREAGAAVRKMESAQRAAVRARTVSAHDAIARIWVAFFSRCQRFRCSQVSQCMVPGTSPENAIVHKCKSSAAVPSRLSPNCSSLSSPPEASKRSGCLYRLGW